MMYITIVAYCTSIAVEHASRGALGTIMKGVSITVTIRADLTAHLNLVIS